MAINDKKNREIRAACVLADMPLWELAYIYGITDTSLSRIFRQELPKEEKEYLLKIIDEYKSGKDPEILRNEGAIRRIDRHSEKARHKRTTERFSPLDKEDYDRHTAEAIRGLYDYIKSSMEE